MFICLVTKNFLCWWLIHLSCSTIIFCSVFLWVPFFYLHWMQLHQGQLALCCTWMGFFQCSWRTKISIWSQSFKIVTFYVYNSRPKCHHMWSSFCAHRTDIQIWSGVKMMGLPLGNATPGSRGPENPRNPPMFTPRNPGFSQLKNPGFRG